MDKMKKEEKKDKFSTVISINLAKIIYKIYSIYSLLWKSVLSCEGIFKKDTTISYLWYPLLHNVEYDHYHWS